MKTVPAAKFKERPDLIGVLQGRIVIQGDIMSVGRAWDASAGGDSAAVTDSRLVH